MRAASISKLRELRIKRLGPNCREVNVSVAIIRADFENISNYGTVLQILLDYNYRRLNERY